LDGHRSGCYNQGMNILLVSASALRLEKITPQSGVITLSVHTVQTPVRCPRCQQVSTHLHSRYVRTLTDLPWAGIRVQIRLHTRRFSCRNDLCPQQIFYERLSEVAAHYARRTARLDEALRLNGVRVGGEAGAQVSGHLGVHISPDTLLRRTRATVLSEAPTPRVLGIDDWAKRKGQRYGTILVDLERRCPVDLLPDREAATLATWLKAHPGVEIISRDRAGAYADGARQGAPNAIQIADRFHLLQNLTEAVERYLQTKPACLQAAAKACQAPAPELSPELVMTPPPQRATKLALWNERRQQRYQEVQQLWRQGATIRSIAEHFGMHRRTVRMLIKAESCPQRLKPAERWSEGHHNAAEMYRELSSQGFRGSASAVRQLVGQWCRDLPAELKRRRRGPRRETPANPRAKKLIPSARRTAWMLLRDPKKLEAEERNYLQQVLAHSPEITSLRDLAQQFSRMVKEKKAADFAAWADQVAESGIAALKSFATGLERDREAVLAALTYDWSNGQTEGQINRLKTLKRGMYGRAKLDLLKVRMLAPP